MTRFSSLLRMLCFASLCFGLMGLPACDDEDDDDNTPSNNNNNNNNNNQANPDTVATLSEVAEGEGRVAVFGDTAFVWTGTASWEQTSSSLTINGRSYYRWTVTMSGNEADDEFKLDILENQAGSTEEGPDDGTYALASGGMTDNDVSISTPGTSYFLDPGSEGSFTLTKTAQGEVLQIELQADGLESGGIGGEDTFVDINAAFKAKQ